ncbi:MAG: ATP-binding cassette domain-containing protein [Alphaproteobacteria bacterium]
MVGANGCGKSTLFRVLQGGLETESGDVFFLPATRSFL